MNVLNDHPRKSLTSARGPLPLFRVGSDDVRYLISNLRRWSYIYRKYELDMQAQRLRLTRDGYTYLNNLPADSGWAQPLRTSGHERNVGLKIRTKLNGGGGFC